MYGFGGYATNEYAASRPAWIPGPLVDLTMRVLQNTYGVVNSVALGLRSVVLKSVYGIPNVLMLKFRGTTLENPSGDVTNTLEL